MKKSKGRSKEAALEPTARCRRVTACILASHWITFWFSSWIMSILVIYFLSMLGYHYVQSLNKTRPKGVNPPGVRVVEIPCKRRGFLFLGMEKRLSAMLWMARIVQFVYQRRPGQVQIMVIRKRSIFLITAILSSVIILAAIFLTYCSYRYNKVMEVDVSAGINEGMYKTIGGTQQWIQIRGKDRSNPVILWLNGGPGFSTIPQTFFHVPLENDFTVVMWDQRGEGKSYAFTGPSIASTMTIERMAADGVELAGFLKQHLGIQKIMIMGHSWGSILGVRMAQMRPDLFSAYIGTGQVVNLREAMELEYPSILGMARNSENDQAVKELEAAGPPPYSKISDYIIPIRWANAFDAVATSEPGRRITFAAVWAFFRLFVLTDKSVREGIAFSQDLMLEPMLDDVVPELGTDFEIPVFFIQGSEDKLSPTSMVRQYYDSISAPEKKMIILENAGHLAILRNRDMFRDALLDIKPLLLTK